MLTNDEIKRELEIELERLKERNQVRRYTVTYRPFTGKFEVWYEFPDGHATTFSDILDMNDLKDKLSKCLPVKKSWKCHICRNFVKKDDRCKVGYYNSSFIPCPDWSGPEFMPTDKDFCDSVDILEAESKQFIDGIEHIHKGVDWIMTFILKMYGYHDGLKLFNQLPKGFCKDIDDACECQTPILSWQCALCRKFSWRETHCIFGLDEGWIANNECYEFIHIEEPINDKMFLYLMEMIYAEHNDNEAAYECLHYNMDKLMSYVVESLGYVQLAKKIRKLPLEYLDVPF